MAMSTVPTVRHHVFVRTKRGLNRSLFSTKKSNDLPPLPASSSPAKAKERYLESKNATDKYLDPHAKIQQLNRELEIVRENAAAKLDKELNKSLYRKLVDPIKRHKHAAINVGAVTLAYLLAHNLFVASKKGKEARAELNESEKRHEDIRKILEALLQDSTLKEIGSACASKFNQRNTQKQTKASFWKVPSSTIDEGEDLEKIVVEVLQRELGARIGHLIKLRGEQKQQVIDDIMKENQENVKALNQDPEMFLKQALESAEKDKTNSSKKESRRVFSM